MKFNISILVLILVGNGLTNGFVNAQEMQKIKVFDDNGLDPPDATIGVGPFSFITAVNGGIKIFSKEGIQLTSSSLNQFFSKTFTFDPRILYDNFNNRFVVSAGNGVTAGNTYVEFAISKSNNPFDLTTNNWYYYSLSLSQVFPDFWCDFPNLGHSTTNLFITCNLFNNARVYGGSMFYSIPKNSLYSGINSSVYTGSLTGIGFTFIPVESNIPSNDPGILVSRINSSQFRIVTLTGALQNQMVNGIMTVPVNSNVLSNAPQLGSSFLVNTGDTRMQNCVSRFGFVWCAFASNINGKGAIHWYKFRNSVVNGIASNVLIDSGTISDNTLHYFRPSIAVTDPDKFYIAFQGSSSLTFPSIYLYTYNGNENGNGSNNSNANEGTVVVLLKGRGPIETNRYGDYTEMQLDPVENSLWVTSEIPTESKNWESWAIKVKLEELELKCDSCIGGECIESAGNFICQCFDNYLGTSCESCKPGHYSEDCIECDCSENEICNDTITGDGSCDCLPTFEKDQNGVCVKKASLCEILDCGTGGVCVEEYQRCLCAIGYYGSSCTECKVCENGGECNWGSLNDGSCICKSGFIGETCEECGSGYYGPDCQRCPDCGAGICSNSIESDPKSPCICPIGYSGSRCQECDTGYIKKITEIESNTERNTETNTENNRETNTFICVEENSVCEPRCNPQGGVCNSQTEKCECKENYTGNSCEQCKSGFYSSFCIKCPDCGQFDNRGTCDTVTGECICGASFEGIQCDAPLCDKPLFIPNDCKIGPIKLNRPRSSVLLQNYTDYYIIDSEFFNNTYSLFLTDYIGKTKLNYDINKLPSKFTELPNKLKNDSNKLKNDSNNSESNNLELPKELNKDDIIYISVSGNDTRNSYTIEYSDSRQNTSVNILWYTWFLFIVLLLLVLLCFYCTINNPNESENGQPVIENTVEMNNV